MSNEGYDRVGTFYLQYYSKQRGRGVDSSQEPKFFRGADSWRPRQRGDGFGSLLRGLARFLLPVLGRGIGTFATRTLDATDRGASLNDAAKSALKPTLRAVIDAGVNRMQKGNGDKKRKLTGGDGGGGGGGDLSFYEKMQEAKRRKKHHEKRQKGQGKKKQKQKQHVPKKNKSQQGQGKLSKKRVYKTSGVFNF